MDLSASGELNGDENEFSPTNNREHSLNNQAAEAADHVMDEYDMNNREDDSYAIGEFHSGVQANEWICGCC